MPRGPRIIIKNAFYHIYNRGNQKQNIFHEETDYEKYLQILKFYKKKFKFKLICYCLMPNHFHLLVEPKSSELLSKFMQGITQSYTLFYIKKYKKPGRLWQGRYQSRAIAKDEYFLACVNYIEANPVRANLVKSPADYKWSSYRERVLGFKGGMLDIPDST